MATWCACSPRFASLALLLASPPATLVEAEVGRLGLGYENGLAPIGDGIGLLPRVPPLPVRPHELQDRESVHGLVEPLRVAQERRVPLGIDAHEATVEALEDVVVVASRIERLVLLDPLDQTRQQLVSDRVPEPEDDELGVLPGKEHAD